MYFSMIGKKIFVLVHKGEKNQIKCDLVIFLIYIYTSLGSVMTSNLHLTRSKEYLHMCYHQSLLYLDLDLSQKFIEKQNTLMGI